MHSTITNLNNFIANALKEDIGDGDHTSLACVPESAISKAGLLVKDNGIIAGIELAEKIFHFIDGTIIFNPQLKDGDTVCPQDIAFTVEGNVHSILKSERLVLNCMQRMSGIATITNNMVSKLQGLKTKLLDTRKTTPGFRALEKWAVTIGGGENHRFGLHDMIMIKDNHIDFCGGIGRAIKSVKSYLQKTNKNLRIEVEARSIGDIEEIMNTGGIHRILLDNFSVERTHKAVAFVNSQYELESSGGITIETLRSYAECGVDYISVGALTHSYKSIDMSLKAVKTVRG